MNMPLGAGTRTTPLTRAGRRRVTELSVVVHTILHVALELLAKPCAIPKHEDILSSAWQARKLTASGQR
jgi:hypothetical protein